MMNNKNRIPAVINLIMTTLIFILFISVAAKTSPPPAPTSQNPGDSIDPMTHGVVSCIHWSEDGKTLQFYNQDKIFRMDLTTGIIEPLSDLTPEEKAEISQEARAERMARYRRSRGSGDNDDPRIKRPTRGRQYMIEKSPDGKWYALCEDWNVVLESIPSGELTPVTTSGDRKFRFGTANWVTGEELSVRHGMWWTPDSEKLIYYVFDERPVRDFYLVGNWSEINTTNLTEGYTKAGDPNPVMSLEIYDLESQTRMPVDCGDGEYIYEMRFTPAGNELLFSRLDRHQRHLEIIALNVNTGGTRVVLTETQKTWQEIHPKLRFLSDGQRFIWETEKTGYRHYELRHLDGRLLHTLTKGDYPVMEITHIDEETGWFYYLANSDPNNPLCAQLHRVRLNGKNHKRLTPKPVNHKGIRFSPDGKWIVLQSETVAIPPSTTLLAADGGEIVGLAQGPDMTNDRSEIFTFKADDGKTDIYGILHKPKDFDPTKEFPLIIAVYGGPDSRAIRQNFVRGHRFNAEKYLVAQVDNRGTSGRGKAFKDAVYGKLGDVDIQDQADAVRYLRQRPYVDGNRIGITGHSYGGYMAAMGILRHPDVFTASVALASVTWYRNYDSIWTERYMNLPQENAEGYACGNCMNFVADLKGHLLIMHGMVDDNVHPNNVFQLTEALNAADKHAHYETRFFPNAGHVYFGREFQDAFFDQHLQPE